MSTPQVIFGAGYVHVTQITDADGNKLSPKQPICAPEVQNVSADLGKSDLKSMSGSREFAIHAATGKKSTEVSFEVGELYANMLNLLYFGQTVTAGSHIIYRDRTGIVMPETYKTNLSIKDTQSILNLGKWKSHTTVEIKYPEGWLEATRITTSAKLTGNQFKVASGIYQFADRDVGLQTRITYEVKDSGAGTTVISTLKIPTDKTYNANAFSKAISINGGSPVLTKDTFDNDAVPDANHYMANDFGVYIFNTAQTGMAGRAIKHTTDSVAVSSVVATLPAGSFTLLLNPPGIIEFKDNVAVTLKSGTITGLSVGDELTKATTPTSGEYDFDADGNYTFSSDDVGAVVTVEYTTTSVFKTVTLPDPDGEFFEDKGGRDVDGIALTRVEITNPPALLRNQYAVDNRGTYYFDDSQAGDKLYIDFEYSTSKGFTLAIENKDMGSSPIVSLDISGKAEGQEWLIKYPRAVPKAFGFATKLDDYNMYKMTYEVLADRVSNVVGEVHLQS